MLFQLLILGYGIEINSDSPETSHKTIITMIRKSIKYGIVWSILLIPFYLSAQSVKEEVELIQSIYGMEKKQVVTQFTGITSDANPDFWIQYDQYEDERKAIGKKRISLIFDYVNNFQTLTDEQLDYLVDKSMGYRSQLDRLIKKYHRRIKKVSNAKTAAQFVQLELNFLDGTRSEIMQGLPKIGQFDN